MTESPISPSADWGAPDADPLSAASDAKAGSLTIWLNLPHPINRIDMGDCGTDSTGIANQLAELHSAPVHSYDDFRALYLSLDPQITDGADFFALLIERDWLEWLDRLVEETLEPEDADPGAVTTAA